MAEDEHRTVEQSRTSLTELMIPAYANFGGKIHGGIILSLMDKVAYACAARHSGRYCVTVSVDGVDFLQPVEVGDLVRPDHEPVRVPLGHFDRLCDRPMPGGFFRNRPLDRRFVHVGRNTLGLDPCIFEHRQSPGTR